MRRPDDGPADARTAEEAARAGLDALYRHEAPSLARKLRSRTGSAEEARDLVHDAFARLLGATSRMAIDRPEAFLNRIVRNLLIDRGRRAATRPVHLPIDAGPEPAARAEQADGIDLAQMRERYRAAVAALPARMREVFVLHRVEDLSYRDIAERLEISVRTVEWHIAEAITRIDKELRQ